MIVKPNLKVLVTNTYCYILCNLHPTATYNRFSLCVTATGDVMCDMEQQLKANSVRIRVLQQENASLSNSLARVKDREEKQRSSDSGTVEIDKEAVAMGPLDNSSTSSPTSPSSILHHQTLCLSLHQDVEERYMNIRQAARIRSAGTRRRRK